MHRLALPSLDIRLEAKFSNFLTVRALAGLRTKSTQCKGRVPPFAALGHLHNVRKHGEKEDDSEDDAGAEIGIVAVCWHYCVGIVGNASLTTL